MNDDVKRLEEKIAYLERHVTEQDKAMLEMAEEQTWLRRELVRLRGLIEHGAVGGGASATDERPPHY